MAEILFFRNAANARVLEPGDILFREGDDGEEMFAVIDGELELQVAGRAVDRVGPGAIVGEMALIDRSPRSATVVARSRPGRGASTMRGSG